MTYSDEEYQLSADINDEVYDAAEISDLNQSEPNQSQLRNQFDQTQENQENDEQLNLEDYEENQYQFQGNDKFEEDLENQFSTNPDQKINKKSLEINLQQAYQENNQNFMKILEQVSQINKKQKKHKTDASQFQPNNNIQLDQSNLNKIKKHLLSEFDQKQINTILKKQFAGDKVEKKSLKVKKNKIIQKHVAHGKQLQNSESQQEMNANQIQRQRTFILLLITKNYGFGYYKAYLQELKINTEINNSFNNENYKTIMREICSHLFKKIQNRCSQHQIKKLTIKGDNQYQELYRILINYKTDMTESARDIFQRFLISSYKLENKFQTNQSQTITVNQCLQLHQEILQYVKGYFISSNASQKELPNELYAKNRIHFDDITQDQYEIQFNTLYKDLGKLSYVKDALKRKYQNYKEKFQNGKLKLTLDKNIKTMIQAFQKVYQQFKSNSSGKSQRPSNSVDPQYRHNQNDQNNRKRSSQSDLIQANDGLERYMIQKVDFDPSKQHLDEKNDTNVTEQGDCKTQFKIQTQKERALKSINQKILKSNPLKSQQVKSIYDQKDIKRLLDKNALTPFRSKLIQWYLLYKKNDHAAYEHQILLQLKFLIDEQLIQKINEKIEKKQLLKKEKQIQKNQKRNRIETNNKIKKSTNKNNYSQQQEYVQNDNLKKLRKIKVQSKTYKPIQTGNYRIEVQNEDNVSPLNKKINKYSNKKNAEKEHPKRMNQKQIVLEDYQIFSPPKGRSNNNLPNSIQAIIKEEVERQLTTQRQKIKKQFQQRIKQIQDQNLRQRQKMKAAFANMNVMPPNRINNINIPQNLKNISIPRNFLPKSNINKEQINGNTMQKQTNFNLKRPAPSNSPNDYNSLHPQGRKMTQFSNKNIITNSPQYNNLIESQVKKFQISGNQQRQKTNGFNNNPKITQFSSLDHQSNQFKYNSNNVPNNRFDKNRALLNSDSNKNINPQRQQQMARSNDQDQLVNPIQNIKIPSNLLPNNQIRMPQNAAVQSKNVGLNNSIHFKQARINGNPSQPGFRHSTNPQINNHMVNNMTNNQSRQNERSQIPQNQGSNSHQNPGRLNNQSHGPNNNQSYGPNNHQSQRSNNHQSQGSNNQNQGPTNSQRVINEKNMNSLTKLNNNVSSSNRQSNTSKIISNIQMISNNQMINNNQMMKNNNQMMKNNTQQNAIRNPNHNLNSNFLSEQKSSLKQKNSKQKTQNSKTPKLKNVKKQQKQKKTALSKEKRQKKKNKSKTVFDQEIQIKSSKEQSFIYFQDE